MNVLFTMGYDWIQMILFLNQIYELYGSRVNMGYIYIHICIYIYNNDNNNNSNNTNNKNNNNNTTNNKNNIYIY